MDSFLDLHKIKELFAEAPFPWFMCGGWAIDLYLGEVTREHKDVDVAIWRQDQLAMQHYLTKRGWTIEVAGGGQLMPWATGEFIELPKHNVWCKHPAHDPDFVEILFNEQDEDSFLFRRNLAIKRPLAKALLQSDQGFSYLAPEIVLLYKAGQPAEPQNQADFMATLGQLSDESRAWLKTSLAIMDREHPWLTNLS